MNSEETRELVQRLRVGVSDAKEAFRQSSLRFDVNAVYDAVGHSQIERHSRQKVMRKLLSMENDLIKVQTLLLGLESDAYEIFREVG